MLSTCVLSSPIRLLLCTNFGISLSPGFAKSTDILDTIISLDSNFEGSRSQKNDPFYHRRSFQILGWISKMDDDAANRKPKLQRKCRGIVNQNCRGIRNGYGCFILISRILLCARFIALYRMKMVFMPLIGYGLSVIETIKLEIIVFNFFELL